MTMMVMKHGDLKRRQNRSFVYGITTKKYAVKDFSLLCYVGGAARSFTCWYCSELFFWFRS